MKPFRTVVLCVTIASALSAHALGQELTPEQRLFMGLPPTGPTQQHLPAQGVPSNPQFIRVDPQQGVLAEPASDAGLPDGPPMTFKVVQTRGASCCEWIAADGVITLTTPQAFKAFLGTLGKKAVTLQESVTFNSPGGDFFAALALGREIRRSTRMWTAVGRTEADAGNAGGGAKAYRISGGVCLSACVLAFMGGKTRDYQQTGGGTVQSLAFQNFALDQAASVLGRPSADAMTDAGLPSSGLLRLAMEGYATEMGVDPAVVALMETANQPGGVHLISQDEADGFGLNTPLGARSKWTLSAVRGGLVLYGSGDDRWTHFTVGLQCLRREPGGLEYSIAVPLDPRATSAGEGEDNYREGITGAEVNGGSNPTPARIAGIQVVAGKPPQIGGYLLVTAWLDAAQVNAVRQRKAAVSFDTANYLQHLIPEVSLASAQVASSVGLLLRNCPADGATAN